MSSQIVKQTTKIDSSLSKINECYYLKFQKPMCRRQIFRIISNERDYVKT